MGKWNRDLNREIERIVIDVQDRMRRLEAVKKWLRENPKPDNAILNPPDMLRPQGRNNTNKTRPGM